MICDDVGDFLLPFFRTPRYLHPGHGAMNLIKRWMSFPASRLLGFARALSNSSLKFGEAISALNAANASGLALMPEWTDRFTACRMMMLAAWKIMVLLLENRLSWYKKS